MTGIGPKDFETLIIKLTKLVTGIELKNIEMFAIRLTMLLLTFHFCYRYLMYYLGK